MHEQESRIYKPLDLRCMSRRTEVGDIHLIVRECNQKQADINIRMVC